MLVVDRVHPDRREGRWPRLTTNPRVIVYEVTTHAIFGALLGLALPRGAGGRSHFADGSEKAEASSIRAT